MTGFKPQPNASNIFEANKGVGLPKRTFKDRMTIGKGNDQVDLYYFGRGHTNGDAWIVFPSLKVMHAGDIFSGKNLPLLDANNGGSGLEIGNTLAKAHAGVKGVESIITGHSTVMTMADLKDTRTSTPSSRSSSRQGKSGPVARSDRRELEDAGQVQGLCLPGGQGGQADPADPDERRGDFRRDQVATRCHSASSKGVLNW